jgi:type IV pilus assembly protein PilO
MNLEWVQSLPTYQKAAAVGLVVVIIIALFSYFFYIPKNNQISSLESEIAKLQNEIGVNETKARRLEELKRENTALERQLAEKKEQLPAEGEIPSLLKQISDLGLRIGLDFRLWKPGTKTTNASGLYAEIPVNVEIAGGYHTTAMFFDRISKLPRIVNIGDLRMSTPQAKKGRIELQTTFVATAFAAVAEAPPAAEGEAKGKGKRKPKKDDAKGEKKPKEAKPKTGGHAAVE